MKNDDIQLSLAAKLDGLAQVVFMHAKAFDARGDNAHTAHKTISLDVALNQQASIGPEQ